MAAQARAGLCRLACTPRLSTQHAAQLASGSCHQASASREPAGRWVQYWLGSRQYMRGPERAPQQVCSQGGARLCAAPSQASVWPRFASRSSMLKTSGSDCRRRLRGSGPSRMKLTTGGPTLAAGRALPHSRANRAASQARQAPVATEQSARHIFGLARGPGRLTVPLWHGKQHPHRCR